MAGGKRKRVSAGAAGDAGTGQPQAAQLIRANYPADTAKLSKQPNPWKRDYSPSSRLNLLPEAQQASKRHSTVRTSRFSYKPQPKMHSKVVGVHFVLRNGKTLF
jgi:hypothetical protein